MKQIAIIPAWFIVKLLGPVYPKTHLFYKRTPTLQQFSELANELCYNLSIGIWIGFIALTIIFFYY